MVIKDAKALLEIVRELRKDGCTRLKVGALEVEFMPPEAPAPKPAGFISPGPQRVPASILEELREDEEAKGQPGAGTATSPIRSVFDEPDLGVPGLPTFSEDE